MGAGGREAGQDEGSPSLSWHQRARTLLRALVSPHRSTSVCRAPVHKHVVELSTSV